MFHRNVFIASGMMNNRIIGTAALHSYGGTVAFVTRRRTRYRGSRVDGNAFFPEKGYFMSFNVPGATVICVPTFSYFMAKNRTLL